MHLWRHWPLKVGRSRQSVWLSDASHNPLGVVERTLLADTGSFVVAGSADCNDRKLVCDMVFVPGRPRRRNSLGDC